MIKRLFTHDQLRETACAMLRQTPFVFNPNKVSHHGSKYSTSALFLENVNPEIAVILVGKNSYGHPTAETLQRLENFGIKVLRTDLDGDIEIVSDGEIIYQQK